MAEIEQRPPKLNSPVYPTSGFGLPGGGGFQFNPGETYDFGVFGQKKQNKLRNKWGLAAGQTSYGASELSNKLKKKIAALGGKSYNPTMNFTADPNSQKVYDAAQGSSLNLINQGFTEEDPYIKAQADKESQAYYDRSKGRLDRSLNDAVTGIRNNFGGSNAPGVMTGALGNVIGEKAVRPYADSLSELGNNTEIMRRGLVDSILGNRRSALGSLQGINQNYYDAGGIVGMDTGLAQNQYMNNYGLQRDQLNQGRWTNMMDMYMKQQQVDAMKQQVDAQTSGWGQFVGAAGGALLGGLKFV